MYNERTMVNFYGRSFPVVGELLVCRIESIGDNSGGYWVKLLEFDEIQGFVGLKEITQAKWFRNLKGLAKEGDIEVMQVIAIGGNGDIDLSRRYITDKSKEKILSRFKLWKRVYDYLDHMVEKDNIRTIVDDLLHPYLREIFKDEIYGVSEDDEDDEILDDQTTIEPLSDYVKRHEVHLQELSVDVLQSIIQLLEKPIELKQHTGHLTFTKLSEIRVTVLNKILDLIKSNFPINVHTYSMKTSTFQFTSKEKITHTTFLSVLEEVQHFVDNLDIEDLSKKMANEKPNCAVGIGGHQPLVNIGVIGHVAHGKTTLIEAISGVDTRRHKKEVASNRTLNIGYTNTCICKCTCTGEVLYLAEKDVSPDCKCPTVMISLVDCPGHNVLLSTMITGAHIMDSCILVVTADEPCPQPQTNEHVAVLQIIGQSSSHFSDAILVQNKVDLVSEERLRNNLSEIETFVNQSIFQNVPIVPTSAQMRLGISNVLCFMYEYATKQSGHKSSDNRLGKAKGIIVRTFDVNKPGSTKVTGAIIGGSVLKGVFSVGEEIVIVPSGINATILSMKSENTVLSQAQSGGLMAIGTDINPTYCNMLIGSSFVKKDDYSAQNVLPSGSMIKVKYHLLHDCGFDKFKKDTRIFINYAGFNSEAKITKTFSDKFRMIVTTSQNLYIYPEENFTFTIVKDKRLVGFGRSTDHPRYDIPQSPEAMYSLPSYEDMITRFREDLATWKDSTMQRSSIPVPRIQYRNTFSTIINFSEICSAAGGTCEELGKFICGELGMKSWSVNSQQQLILKGRTDERRVVTILRQFIKDSRCKVCRQNKIKIVKNMGVKQRVCTNCSWKA